jgi:hypothetical protein
LKDPYLCPGAGAYSASIWSRRRTLCQLLYLRAVETGLRG